MRFKSGWKDPVDSESAGASKTTLSTQRPLISGKGFANQHIKLFSKAKNIISYQKGRFSSDNSYIRLR